MNEGTLLYVIALVAAFYFLIIRPQQQRQRQLRELMTALSTGDRVITAGGIHGTVVRVLDTTVVLRVLDNSEIEFEKMAIARITTDVPPIADDDTVIDEFPREPDVDLPGGIDDPGAPAGDRESDAF
ncbi:MAG: preprotein translocase subunit YajC [Actinobacteria bacterium HGW-Actinobacteria-10]|jgi:preprotein translocase subunit YajC|nr:MAG: preprotein translocase subunit YajC [Actinobacteria bacterium HGW-Actinobacteria-10]